MNHRRVDEFERGERRLDALDLITLRPLELHHLGLGRLQAEHVLVRGFHGLVVGHQL